MNWLDADRRDDVTCTESFAALELQHYLRQMTGRKDDFAIVADDKVARAKRADPAWLAGVQRRRSQAGGRAGGEQRSDCPAGIGGLSHQTGRCRRRRVTLIAGGGREGTLYGVYDLLHRLGCRWFGPEPFDEEVPRRAWNPSFDVTQQPSFSVRGFYVYRNAARPR